MLVAMDGNHKDISVNKVTFICVGLVVRKKVEVEVVTSLVCDLVWCVPRLGWDLLRSWWDAPQPRIHINGCISNLAAKAF